MRAPYQVLAIPYRKKPVVQYCVLHRSDMDQYQFVADGGEDDDALAKLTWDSNKTALYELNCRLVKA